MCGGADASEIRDATQRHWHWRRHTSNHKSYHFITNHKSCALLQPLHRRERFQSHRQCAHTVARQLTRTYFSSAIANFSNRHVSRRHKESVVVVVVVVATYSPRPHVSDTEPECLKLQKKTQAQVHISLRGHSSVM